MSDFLTNLAARSFGSVSAILPRLASLFEPVHAGAISFRGPVRLMSPDETVASDDIEFETARPRQSLNRESQSDSTPAREVRRKPTLLPVEVISDNLRTEEQTSPEPISEQHGARPVQPRPHSSDALERSSPVQVRAIRSLRSERQSPEQNPPTSQVQPDLELTPGPAVSANLLQPATANQVIAPGNIRGMFSFAPPFATHERISDPALLPRVRRGHEPTRLVSPQMAAESEPSIQVTIGRIEVRAATTSTPARRAEPTASPVMSLEEYLRRQAKRGGE
jgi:hypothetical protein